MDTDFEQIIPWNGAQDTGYDVRMKWMRNFAKIASALNELAGMNTERDEAIESILKELENFLRKDKEDSTGYLLRMLAGAHFFSFVQGMIGGSGAAFYKNAAGKTYMEADGAYLRDELITPKITFNCIDVISGDKANTFAFGTIKSVDTENKIAELDLLEDQTGTLHVDDICRGVFHNLEGSNLKDDMEDNNGFYGYAGFSTSYFTPTEIIESSPGVMKFRYNLQAGTSVHPMKGMNFFAYGNFTDKTRQSITYETRYYTRRLKDVNTWVIDPTRNISMQDGLLEGLTIGGMVMHGYGTYQENCYFTGVNIQFTPDTEEALKGQDAYSVSLSSYERVVKMDADGNIVSLLEALNVVTGDGNVTTGDENVITTQKRIQTHIQAFKGSSELIYSETMDAGVYKVTLNPQGCTASVEGGIVSIDSITATENCFVDITINCEGNAVFDKRFSVSIIRDGVDAQASYVLDMDNEMAAVSAGPDGAVVSGLPVSTTLSMYFGTEQQTITSVTVDAPEGITYATSADTVTVTAIDDSLPDNIEIGLTAAVTDDAGLTVTRAVTWKILKLKQGKDAVIYQLKPDCGAIKVSSDGVYSCSTLTCYLCRQSGGTMEYLSAVPDGYALYLQYDSKERQAYTPENVLTATEIKTQATFALYDADGRLVDTETVPVVKDGADGAGSVILDMDNEMGTVTVGSDGIVTAGLPITVGFSMYFGTKAIEITEIAVSAPTGVTVTADASSSSATISAVGAAVADSTEIAFTVTGTYESVEYVRSCKFNLLKLKPGEKGDPATVYQLVPSTTVVRKSDETFTPGSVSCGVTRTDSKGVETVSTLPDGLSMCYVWEGSTTEYSYRLNNSINISSVGVAFLLYYNGVLIDKETVPVVVDGVPGKDGAAISTVTEYWARSSSNNTIPSSWSTTCPTLTSTYKYLWKYTVTTYTDGTSITSGKVIVGVYGDKGDPGSPGGQGIQGLQGCVIRRSIWRSGMEYRNDSELTDTSIIRYIDVVMVQNPNYTSGWEAYRCKITHTSSITTTYTDTTYWEAFSQDVSALFADLIIAKDAQITFLQGNRIIVVDEDNGITAGMSGSTEGSGIRFWAGSMIPDSAPFRVDYLGNIYAENGTFMGVISAKTMIMQRSTAGVSEVINGALIGMDLEDIGLFPSLSGTEVRVIDLICPLMSRTMHSVTLQGVNSNVRFCPNGDRFSSSTSLYISDIQGCYFKCIGHCSGSITYWEVFPMNDTATNVMS